MTSAESLLAATSRARAAHPETPVVLVGLGGLATPLPGVTVFHAVDHAVEAVAGACRYAEWRDAPHADGPPHDVERAARARALAHELVGSETRWLDHGAASSLLEPYGLVPVGVEADDPVEASRLAQELGFPVVVKVADGDIVHKTDRGLVRMGLTSSREVVAAVDDVARELGRDHVRLLVQPIVEGVEVAAGVVRDPRFGPMVMVAAGGVATGILEDRAFLLPPFTGRDAARAIRSLRIWPLLDGYRGSPRTDVDGLETLLVALGELAIDVPQVAELDLNPIMCSSSGVVLVDVKVRVAEADAPDAGVPRRLRTSG